MSKYPQFQLPQDHEGVFEKDGGLLMATKAVGTLQVRLWLLCWLSLVHDITIDARFVSYRTKC